MRASVRVVADGGTFPVLRSEPPVAVRPTADACYLVGSAAGPLGGDEIHLDVVVRDGSALVVRSTAATIALPGPGHSVVRTHARVGAAASLQWSPEPVVVTARADHVAETTVELARDARCCWREEIVLGRDGEPGGRARLRLVADRGGRALLRHELDLGPGSGSYPRLGPGRALGALLVVGAPPPEQQCRDKVEHAVLALAPDAAVVHAVGDTVAVRALLDDLERSVRTGRR